MCSSGSIRSMTVVVFDVNETLLDLSVLRPGFDELFGDGAAAMREWFPSLLHASLVTNELKSYESFGQLASRALRSMAARRSVTLPEELAADLLKPFRSLPPHPDVVEGLTMLAAEGVRMAALTNTSYDSLAELLANAGVAPFLEQILSVDEVRRFKPAPEPYLMAADKLDVDITDVVMVASHDWDLMGARAAGARSAFIARLGSVWSYPDASPDYEGGDLIEVASQIIADVA